MSAEDSDARLNTLRRNGSPPKKAIVVPIYPLGGTQRIDRVFAVEQIRRMRGATQSQLLRCSDGGYYVVKFQNNPQGIAVLASDLLGTLLAIQLGLPVQQPALVDVQKELIGATEDMVIQLARGRTPCKFGVCFGSRYPIDKSFKRLLLDDFLPDEGMQRIDNLADYAGMLVFDQWTCNTDNRQTIFVSENKRVTYHASMIDQGNCFNGARWNFPDSPLWGIYSNRTPYLRYQEFSVFEPWLSRLENNMNRELLRVAGNAIPAEWYRRNTEALDCLLERLDRRRLVVRDLLWRVLKSSPKCFPNWNTESQLALGHSA